MWLKGKLFLENLKIFNVLRIHPSPLNYLLSFQNKLYYYLLLLLLLYVPVTAVAYVI
jgi:hypothetical protein